MQPPRSSFTIADWLTRDRPPENLYELLSVELFDPDLGGLQRRVPDASRELLAWQNHSDPSRAQRATQLQRALGNAQDALAAPERLEAVHEQLASRLFERYVAHSRTAPSRWRDAALRNWLRSTAGVHDAAVAAVANRLLAKVGPGRVPAHNPRRSQPETSRASWSTLWVMRQASRVMRRPSAYAIMGGCLRSLMRVLPRFVLYSRFNGWGREHELPLAPKHSFRRLWKQRQVSSAGRVHRSAG